MKKISERKKAYLAYLKTPHWKGLREAVFKRDGHRCVECNDTHRLEGHHRVYRTPLESCTTDDIVTLCRRCHRVEHGRTVAWPFEELYRKLLFQMEGLRKPITKAQFEELKSLALCRFDRMNVVGIHRSNNWLQGFEIDEPDWEAGNYCDGAADYSPPEHFAEPGSEPGAECFQHRHNGHYFCSDFGSGNAATEGHKHDPGVLTPADGENAPYEAVAGGNGASGGCV